MFAFLKKPEAVDTLACKALLASLKLFSWMDDAELKRLVEITQVVHLKKGKYLMKEGDKSDALFVVAKGSVAVEEKGVSLGVVGTGELLGEMALLTGEPRSASAFATEDSVLLQVGRLDFLALESKTEFLHFKVWCAFALHRFETFLIETGKLPEIKGEARAAWLKKFEISELKMAEEATPPAQAHYLFVAHGFAVADLKEFKAPALTEVSPKAHVSSGAGHTVLLWLPKPD